MAKEIKQRIVLEGEKDYSQALKDAQRNLRTLRSELKAETAELGNNATASQKAETRTKNLKRQIAEQEKIVKTYEAALEEVREKYADNEDAIASWTQKLNNARATLATMRNDLDGVGSSLKTMQTDASGAVVATKSVADAIQNIASVGDTVAGKIEGIFSGMVNAIRNALSSVWGVIAETAARAGEYNDIASLWNTDAQTVQQYANAVKAAGSDFAALQNNMTKIVMGDHDKIAQLTGVSWMGDTDQWQYAMDVLGSISSMDYTHQMQALEEIFGEKRSTAMKNVLDNWQRVQELLPMFNGNTSGYGLSDSALETFDKIDKKIAEIQTKWEGLKKKVVEGLGVGVLGLTVNISGALDGVADYLVAESEEDKQAALDKIRTNLEDFFHKLAEIVRECLKILNDIGHELQESDDPLTKAIGDILTSLTDALKWMVENADAVKAAFQAIFGLWLVARIGAMAGNLASLVKNLQAMRLFKNLNLNGGPSTTGGDSGGNTGGNNGGGGPVPVTGGRNGQNNGGNAGQNTGSNTGNNTGSNTGSNTGNNTGNNTGSNPGGPGVSRSGPGQNTGNTPTQNTGNSGGNSPTVRSDPNWKMQPADSGGGDNLGPGAAGGVGATLGMLLKDMALLTGEGLLVTAIALAPALIAQAGSDKATQEDYEEAAAAIHEAAEVLGDAAGKDAEIAEAALKAGLVHEGENGELERGPFGFLRRTQTDQADQLLQMLSDPKQRGDLYALLRNYGAEGGVLGNDPWQLLLRYWGNSTTKREYRAYPIDYETGRYGDPYDTEYEAHDDNPLDPQEVNALVEYLRDAYIRRLQRRMEQEAGSDAALDGLFGDLGGGGGGAPPRAWRLSADQWPGTGGGSSGQQGITGQDLQGFRGLPAQLQRAIQAGAAEGVSNIRVYMDGTIVGRLVAPTVSQAIARQVF